MAFMLSSVDKSCVCLGLGCPFGQQPLLLTAPHPTLASRVCICLALHPFAVARAVSFTATARRWQTAGQGASSS